MSVYPSAASLERMLLLPPWYRLTINPGGRKDWHCDSLFAFAVLWLTSLCPCVRLYCNSSVSTVLYRTCLAACKLHACFYVIGESLLTAARIPHPLYLWGLGKIYLFCHPLLSPPPQMNSFSLGVDHHDFHVKDGSPYDRPSLMSLTISLLFQNSCCKIIIVNNNNHSKEKVNGYFLLAFL